MENNENKKQAIYERGPADKPYAKIIITEKRSGLKDRRKLHTYIADDRRSGVADRRKKSKLKGKI